MATHTALTANDANLHLKLQHGFHDAQVSLWVDGDLAYSGKITGAPKKKFGLIPTDSVRGSLFADHTGSFRQHSIRVRIEANDAGMQEDSISGDFAHNAERHVFVSARPSALGVLARGQPAPLSGDGQKERASIGASPFTFKPTSRPFSRLRASTTARYAREPPA